MIVTPTGRRPVGSALAPVADLSLGIWGSIGSGVCGSRVACLGPGREGREITWRMAHASTVAYALRHRVHLVVHQPFDSLAPP